MLACRRVASWLFLLGSLTLVWQAAAPLWACYAVVVGREASSDGSVLVGHNEENGGKRVLHFYKIPRQQHAPGTMVALDKGGKLEETAETAAFLWSENPGLAYSDGYLNEWGVAVVSDGCPSREDNYETLVERGEIRNGGIGYMLRRLTAMRAKSAREGVELIGRLVERFGYIDSGRTYVVADPREAWLVAVVRGRRWAAQRVPDNRVAIVPNVYTIGEMNLSDTAHFRGSSDLVSYAIARGWHDPRRGEPFDFRKAYQRPDRLAPDRRQFRGQELAAAKPGTWPPTEPLPFAVTPGKKLAVSDVVAILRDRSGIAPLFGRITQESAVFQLRAHLPAEIGCIYWRTPCRPDVSPLLPWHVGATSTRASCGPKVQLPTLLSLERHFEPPAEAFQSDPENSTWWKFKDLATLVDEGDATRVAKVAAAWATLEHDALGKQQSVEAEALTLWRKSPDAARAYLTRYCAGLAAEADQTTDGFRKRFRAP